MMAMERIIEFGADEPVDVWCATCGCAVLSVRTVVLSELANTLNPLASSVTSTAYPCGHTDGIRFRPC